MRPLDLAARQPVLFAFTGIRRSNRRRHRRHNTCRRCRGVGLSLRPRIQSLQIRLRSIACPVWLLGVDVEVLRQACPEPLEFVHERETLARVGVNLIERRSLTKPSRVPVREQQRLEVRVRVDLPLPAREEGAPADR